VLARIKHEQAANPGRRAGFFFWENFFLFSAQETCCRTYWPGPVLSLFTFCLDAKSNKKIKAPEKWLKMRE
jgi:hypothetical protein